MSRSRLGVLDDNNYPFSNGRVVGQPDPNEFIVIRLDTPLLDDDEHDDEREERDRKGSGVKRKR